MVNLLIVTVTLIFGGFNVFATPTQQISRKNTVLDCGKVSFVQIGQNTQMFFDEDVSKKCYNIQPDQHTMLHLQTVGCRYNVQAFPSKDCDEDGNVKSFSLNSDNQEVNLNAEHPEISSYMMLSV